MATKRNTFIFHHCPCSQCWKIKVLLFSVRYGFVIQQVSEQASKQASEQCSAASAGAGGSLSVPTLYSAASAGAAARPSSPLCAQLQALGCGGWLRIAWQVVVSNRALAKRASKEEKTFPRVLFNPEGNVLPPEMQVPRIANISNFKIVVCWKSHVSPSGEGGLKRTPPECPHVMEHIFAY